LLEIVILFNQTKSIYPACRIFCLLHIDVFVTSLAHKNFKTLFGSSKITEQLNKNKTFLANDPAGPRKGRIIIKTAPMFSIIFYGFYVDQLFFLASMFTCYFK
jgi:hypothetical protein